MRWQFLVVILLAVAVPFQGALAVSAAQCMALQHHQDTHDGHEGHKHDSNSHCGSCTACCASAAIASPISLVSHSAGHDTLNAVPGLVPPGELPDGLDRPPRSL